MPETDPTPTTDRAGHVCSTAELGHAGGGAKQHMTTDDRIAIWGCCICANVWEASSNQPLGFVWAAIWVCFGAAIIYASKTRDRAA